MVNPCDLCDARCCKEYLVTVTSFDVLKIIKRTCVKPEKFCHLAPCNILNYDTRAMLSCYSGRYSTEHLLALKSWPCHFLKAGRCSIYPYAPLACRQYPYSIEGKKMTRASCPPVSNILFTFKKPHENEYNLWLERYHEIVEKWNAKRGTKEECIEFLMEESEKFSEEI